MTHTAFRSVAIAAVVTLAGCTLFDTNINNPNAIEEKALRFPANQADSSSPPSRPTAM